MAIAHRASATHNETDPTSDTTLTIPASVQADDILLVATKTIGSNPYANSVTDDDTGGNTWTQISEFPASSSSVLGLWWKRATSGSAGKTVTIDMGTATSAASLISAFSGCLASGDPFENVTEESNATGDESMTGLTPSVNGAMILLIVGQRSNDNAVSNQSSTDPGVLTEFAEALSTGGSDTGVAIAGAVQATANATGNLTWSQANGQTLSLGLNLMPATAPPAGNLLLRMMGQGLYVSSGGYAS